LGYVAESDLPDLTAGADAFICFGLPLAQAKFVGMREDKKAAGVQRDRPIEPEG
jgi:hypothetical protein